MTATLQLATSAPPPPPLRPDRCPGRCPDPRRPARLGALLLLSTRRVTAPSTTPCDQRHAAWQAVHLGMVAFIPLMALAVHRLLRGVRQHSRSHQPGRPPGVRRRSTARTKPSWASAPAHWSSAANDTVAGADRVATRRRLRRQPGPRRARARGVAGLRRRASSPPPSPCSDARRIGGPARRAARARHPADRDARAALRPRGPRPLRHRRRHRAPPTGRPAMSSRRGHRPNLVPST